MPSEPDSRLEPRIDWERVPIFPLPETVFFPRTHLPLHVFEPRYREMTADCIEQRLPMAICLAKPGEDLSGHAEVFPIAGVGIIERHERLADGRYNLLLRGIARMRIVEERPNRPYRVVRAEPLPDRLPDDGERALKTPCATARACVERLAALTASQPTIAAEVLRRLAAATDAALLADTLAGMFVADALARQALLEELDVTARLEKVTSALADLLLRAELARKGGNETVQ